MVWIIDGWVYPIDHIVMLDAILKGLQSFQCTHCIKSLDDRNFRKTPISNCFTVFIFIKMFCVK